MVAYLVEHYGEQGPSPDLSWKEMRTTVIMGKTEVEYVADTERGTAKWEIWISFPVDAPEAAVYEAMVFRRSGDFYWEGTVDAAGPVADSTTSSVVVPQRPGERWALDWVLHWERPPRS